MTESSIKTIAQLENLYGTPAQTSLTKEIDHINNHYKAFIQKSPFVVIATSGVEGLDCSPRGDPAGFVRIQDEKTVLIPDRRGNNRLDTLRNIIHDPRISLLFLIPGIGQTIRINGTAELSINPELLKSFEVNGQVPKSVVVVTVGTIYFQCPKALVRSKLWNPEQHVDKCELPSAGQIIQAISKDSFDGKAYDDAYPERLEKTLY